MTFQKTRGEQNRRGLRRFCLGSLLFGLLLSVGCATHADRAVVIRRAYHQGELQTALSQTVLKNEKKAHDSDVTKLDRAMIQLVSGNAQESEKLLREVRDRFDHLEQKSLAEQAAALMTDDRKLAYSGEEYEKILIRVMLALSNLMRDGGDVHAYTLQISAKQQELLQKSQQPVQDPNQPPPPDYTALTKQMAIGSYLRAAVLESSVFDYDDVQRCRVEVANWQPEFRDAKIDLARAETGRAAQPGNGVVYVMAMVGEGPYKQEEAAVATTISLLIADRILSAVGKHELPPNIAPVRIPVVVRSPQTLDCIAVSQGGQTLGTTATIMDVTKLAIEQNRLDRDDVIARAVARRIVKKGAVYAAKEGLQTQNSPEIDLLLTIAGVAWEATERADTRCWSLLPDRIQVLRLELPEGQHVLNLTPQGRSAASGQATPVTVDVRSGKSSFVLGAFPRDKPIGPIQVKNYH